MSHYNKEALKEAQQFISYWEWLMINNYCWKAPVLKVGRVFLQNKLECKLDLVIKDTYYKGFINVNFIHGYVYINPFIFANNNKVT